MSSVAYHAANIVIAAVLWTVILSAVALAVYTIVMIASHRS